MRCSVMEAKVCLSPRSQALTAAVAVRSAKPVYWRSAAEHTKDVVGLSEIKTKFAKPNQVPAYGRMKHHTY